MSIDSVTGGGLPDSEFLTVGDVAALLRCHPRTIINRIRAGTIQAFRIDGTRCWLIPTGEYYRVKAKLLEGAWK